MKFHRRTEKKYYADPYLSRCTAEVVKIEGEWVELTSTVAYPEGGGQDADYGEILLPSGASLRFIDVKKMYGHSAGLSDFPDIQVDGIILHLIHPEDQHLLAMLLVGTKVTVCIDIPRRAALSLSHTASHLLYLAVGLRRPDAVAATLGCHIRIGNARFDFGVKNRVSSDDLELIQATANGFVERNSPVTLSSHPEVIDARTWHCEGYKIPCGGTHLDATGAVGKLLIRRKSLGANKERLSCEFPDAKLELIQFHD
jgi:Ser-tRNA(Ala) deacylase AlaX